ncbi:hypothetical protein ACVWXO_010937 [Bradyrhizobium sp. LM2.7]
MRVALLLTATIIGALFANPSNAGPLEADAAQPLPPGFQSYRGYMFDLSENSDRKDVDKLTDNLKHQIDVVEDAGLSPRVLRFFRTVPIVASELACLDEGAATACYGRVAPNVERRVPRMLTVWDHDKQQWTNPNAVDLAVDSGLGVIMLRPDMMRYEKEAVLLHELLHAYHARLLPDGYDNKGVQAYYAYTKSKDVLPKEAYALKNHMEVLRRHRQHLPGRKERIPRSQVPRNAQGEDAGLLQISGRRVRLRPRPSGRVERTRRLAEVRQT